MEQENRRAPENTEEQNLIRQYLLGNLSDKTKMREIEENLLVDEEFAGKLSAAEDKLVEDYLDDRLTDLQAKSFTRFFLVSQKRKQKMKLIRNLRKYAAHTKTQTVKKDTGN